MVSSQAGLGRCARVDPAGERLCREVVFRECHLATMRVDPAHQTTPEQRRATHAKYIELPAIDATATSWDDNSIDLP